MESNSFYDKFCDSTVAKLQMYEAYFKRYLNVLKMAYPNYGQGKPLLIADLFAGRGEDRDSCPGSPLRLLNYLESTYLDGLKVKIVFNERDKEFYEHLNCKVSEHKCKSKKWITVSVCNQDYDEILTKIINAQRTTRKNTYYKRFFFIDPFGYKGTKIADMLDLLEDRDTEVLLFVPAAFIYRFKGQHENYVSIERFLDDFTSKSALNCRDNKDFIRTAAKNLRQKLSEKNVFVDHFIIQDRQHAGYNCLFYFTSNKVGLEKYVEAKWSIDKDNGEAFVHGSMQQVNLFEDFYMETYAQAVESFLSVNRSNLELRDFGYLNGMLTKHTTKVLKSLEAAKRLAIETIEGGRRQQSSYYLTDKTRRIQIRMEKV